MRSTTLASFAVTAALVMLCVPGQNASAADSAPQRFGAGASVELRHDDNVGLSSIGADKFDEFSYRLNLDLSYALIQEAGMELEATLSPFYTSFPDLDDISSYGATIGLAFRGEFGTEFSDPWYMLSADYTFASFDDSDPRDGDWINMELAIGKRFNPQFGISGGYRYFQRWQDDSNPDCPNVGPDPGCFDFWSPGEVFDQQRHGLFVRADLFLVQDTSFFFENTYWRGDVNATGRDAEFRINEPHPDGNPIFFTDHVAVQDTAFGTDPRYSAWRVDADFNITELGAAHSLSENLTISGSVSYFWTMDVKSPKGRKVSLDDYENLSFSLRLGLRF